MESCGRIIRIKMFTNNIFIKCAKLMLLNSPVLHSKMLILDEVKSSDLATIDR